MADLALRSARDLLGDMADRRSQTAVEFKGRTLRYGDITDWLHTADARLRALRNARLLVLLPDSIGAYLLHLSAFVAGATIVPQSVHATPAQVADAVDRIKPDVIVTTAALGAKLGSVGDTVPVAVVDGDAAAWLTGAAMALVTGVVGRIGAGRRDEDVRVVMFTSGSTGTPKGVCLTERNLLAAAGMMVDFLALGPGRKSVATVPLYDYYGLIQVFGHALSGATLVLGQSLAFPGSLLQTVADPAITDLVAVPYGLRQLVRRVARSQPSPLRHLRFVTSSSDVLSEDVLTAVFALNPDVTVVDIYGLTEAGRACYRRISAASPRSRPIVRPSAGVEVRIEGSDGAAGRIGEIVLRGPNVMKGYLTRVAEDGIEVDPTEEIHTGDLGYWSEHGEIVLVGRRDDLINLHGAKIHPAEIEAAALRAPYVEDARARAEQRADGEKRIVLDVVFASGMSSPESLEAVLRAHLPHPFVPAAIRPVTAIERTELGAKVLRRGDA